MNTRVLIVDDDSNFLEFCRFILSPPPFADRGGSAIPKWASPLDFEVVTVSTAEQALSQVQTAVTSRLPFAAIFLDLDLDGKIQAEQLLRQLADCDPSILFVLVSRSAEKKFEVAEKSFGLEGAHRWDILSSPFSEQEFLHKATHVVSLWNRQQMEAKQKEKLPLENPSENQKLRKGIRLKGALEVNQEMEFHKNIENKSLVQEPGPVALVEVLRKAIQTLQSGLESRRVSIVEVWPEEIPHVIANADELRTLFLNLLKNTARDARPSEDNAIRILVRVYSKHVIVKFEEASGKNCSVVVPIQRGKSSVRRGKQF